MMPDPRHDLAAVLLLAVLAFVAMRWAYAPGGAIDAARRASPAAMGAAAPGRAPWAR